MARIARKLRIDHPLCTFHQVAGGFLQRQQVGTVERHTNYIAVDNISCPLNAGLFRLLHSSSLALNAPITARNLSSCIQSSRHALASSRLVIVALPSTFTPSGALQKSP